MLQNNLNWKFMENYALNRLIKMKLDSSDLCVNNSIFKFNKIHFPNVEIIMVSDSIKKV